jgi:hypothetical protein
MKRTLLIFFLANFLFAQGLFESAQLSSGNTYELGGDIRSSLYVDGKIDSLYSKNIYSQAHLKLKAKKDNIGFAYADLRFSSYNYLGEQTMDINLHEAYVDVSLGAFNIRLGKQILPWGRADAYKSTDNITPQDMRFMYIDPNDMRIGNFLLNSFLQIGPTFRVQGIWIPTYAPNILPISVFDIPDGVQYRDMDIPEGSFSNSGRAVKVDLLTSEYDVSFSYLNAYALQPGFAAEMQIISSTLISYDFFQQTWRQEVFGFDAAMNYNAWSIRCEGSYMLPDDDSSGLFIPQPEIQWTFELDRSWGALHLMLEYNGKFVLDFKELTEPTNPMLMMDHQLAVYNQLFFRQTEEYTHNIFARASLNMFHETVEIEVPFTYNFSTQEYFIAAGMKIDMADALQLSLGMNLYHGKENTLFELLKPLYNGYYCELKLTF